MTYYTLTANALSRQPGPRGDCGDLPSPGGSKAPSPQARDTFAQADVSPAAHASKQELPAEPRRLGRIAATHQAIDVAEVKAGDICFFYRHDCTHYMHGLILAAQSARRLLTSVEKLVDSQLVKKPRIMHCGVVTSVDAVAGSIKLAEASGGRQKVVQTALKLRPDPAQKSVSDGTCDYIFYRISDPLIASEAAKWAKALSQEEVLTYAMNTARSVAFRLPHLGPFGRRRLQKIADRATCEAMSPQMFGSMMCSEFVVTCGVAASVTSAGLLRVNGKAPNVIAMLNRNVSSRTFMLDPTTAMPMALHQHLNASEGIETVGFIRSRMVDGQVAKT